MIPWVWGGVALNMRNEPTSSLEFRKALQYVLNRDVFGKRFSKPPDAVAGPFAAGSSIHQTSLQQAMTLNKQAFS